MTEQHQLRILVRGAYDLQKLRIQAGNRIAANFKAKLGQAPSKSEATIDPEAQKILKILRASYKRLTDGLVRFPNPKGFEGDEVISNFTDLCLVSQYVELLGREEDHFKRLEFILTEFPIYDKYLREVRGIGPAMAGVLISEIDIHKAKHSSSLWAYGGLDVAGDGAGRSRRKEHLIRIKYKAKDGTEKERDSITFNPFLKTKLLGVLGPSFLRAKSPYREHYDNYKHRLESRPDFTEGDKKPKGHRHNAAIRYMVKMFLIDLYVKWRTLEGLLVSAPYHEAKLGHKHAA